MLIGVHEGLEELFTADNGYLVNHSSNGISDVTIAFSEPENMDFDILYVILLTFRINFIMRYCASGSHCGFSHFG